MKDVTVVYETSKGKMKGVKISFEKGDDQVKILTESVQSIKEKYFKNAVVSATLVEDGLKAYLVVVPLERYLSVRLSDVDNDLSLGEEMDL